MAEDNPPVRAFEPRLASTATDDRFRAIFEKAGVGLVLIDEQCHIFDLNRTFCDIVGREPSELLGSSCMSITHPDDVPTNEAVIAKLAAPDEQTASFEKRYLRPDGHHVWVRINLTKIPFDEGERVLAVVEDISDQKRAEEKLRESEDRLRLATESADIGTWDFNPITGQLRWDDRCKQLFGLPPDAEVTYETFLAGLAPEDRDRTDQAVQRALEPDGPGEYDVEYRTIGLKDRVERRIAAKGRAVFQGENESRRATRFIGTVIDVTARHRAEEQLRDEGHNLEILNRTGAALAGELELERVVQMVTDAGVELTGAQFGAFFYNVLDEAGESYMLYTLSGVPRSAFERFPMPRNTKVFAPTFSGEGIVRSDDITKDPRYGKNPPHRGQPKGHLPVVSYLAVPVIGRTGEVIGGLFFGHPQPARFKPRHEQLMEGIAAQAAIAIDNARLFRDAQREIEQRMKVEQALTALNENLESRVAEEVARRSHAEDALRQAQKMETVGQLSGGIAHDFNNLLQVIQGNLGLLQQSVPAGEERWQRWIANGLSGAERASALTRRLLAFSRRQPLEPKPVNVNRMLEDMAELLQRTLGETIAIETSLEPDIRNANVDQNQLENAILNLAINARDAMPAGGKLGIATAVVEIDEDYAQVHPDAARGCFVCIRVSDTGGGMSRSVLDRAIEPFFTTKEVGQGTGLGLSMVYGFLKQSGGHLDLQSKEGAGTIVELFLPCSDEQGEAASEAAATDQLPRGNGETVLVCEDDEEVRRFSTEALAELGYRVLEADDAQAALARMVQDGPVHLLFSDVVLPGGMTGADLAADARQLQPDVKVLLTTGYARTALDNATNALATDLIAKPFSVHSLARRVREILG